MPTNSLLLTLVALNVLFGIVCITILILILRKLLFNKKRIAALINAYHTSTQPEGNVYEKQTIALGRMVRYRKCTTVSFSPEGLFLSISFFGGRQPPILIPWNEIARVTQTRLYGREALMLWVGTPLICIIKVYPSLFSMTEPYLKHL